ncbi:MAG: lipid-A-disaccharide synthase [Planctomycetota bacterium]
MTIFMSAAEASGDEHAARLIEALRERIPSARFIGVAGEKMAEAGCEVLADLTKRASMLGGPILRLRYYVKTIRRVQQQIREIAPDVHIPVDSPAMNWHLAAAAKSVGSPVVYYIAPQVWAWAPWRVRKLARLTDCVACILPFEQRYLQDRGVNATYVGHPLFETLTEKPDKPPDLAEAWSQGTWRVAMLPGSRPAEIRHHSRALLAAARKITRRWPKSKCTFLTGSDSAADAVRRACRDSEMNIAVGRMREMLARSHFAVAVSGTVTLEVAHFGVPMVVLYRTSRLFRVLHKVVGRWGVPTPHFSLVNILAGRRVVPELMPWHGSKRSLSKMVLEVLDDLGYLFETRKALLDLLDPIRRDMKQSASDRTAELVCKILKERRAI